jgi:uncharacterized repeat protein (TIGR04076 family)
MKKLDLSIDYNTIKNDDDYKKIWSKIARVEIKMIEKIGKCKHNINDSFVYETPYKKPQDVCNALLHVLDLYTWRVAFGFPSWEKDDRQVFRIHCPSKKGTVWEIKRLPAF